MFELRSSLRAIEERIDSSAARAGRKSEEVLLLPVSKRQPLERVRSLLEIASHSLGENYVQEAEQRKTDLADYQFEMHLIGALQRNKVKRAIQLFELIQTVDRESLLREINKQAAALGVRQAILFQVNVSSEASKSGISPKSLPGLANLLQELAHVELQGLMCIGSSLLQNSEQLIRREFSLLRNLKEETERQLSLSLPHLSMGMSSDFELAIEEGATIVRVGSALFGQRD